MKKSRYWVTLFLALLLADIIFILLENIELRTISKSLLMPALIGLVWFSKVFIESWRKTILTSALICSFFGDMFLQFDYFIPGLISFLVAHIFYIILFNKMNEYIFFSTNNLLVFIVFLMVVAMLPAKYLVGFEHNMWFPVFMYSWVILTMVWMAVNLNQPSSKIIIGAILFVVSDFILAFNMFKAPLTNSGVFVMLTYGIAQLLIVLGMKDREEEIYRKL